MPDEHARLRSLLNDAISATPALDGYYWVGMRIDAVAVRGESAGMVAAGNGHSLDGVAGDEGGDSLKLVWRDLMAELGRVVLSTHEADPHRYDQQRVDTSKKSYDFAIALLIVAGAAVVVLLNSVVW